jgi:acylphosphatase
MNTIKINIIGSFQGGFFKKLIKDKADEIGIRGFIRSTEDGLEIFIEGNEDKVKNMFGLIKIEAERAKARNLKFERVKYQGFIGFRNSYL